MLWISFPLQAYLLSPSAGSRDSPLTNHGVLQAERLGKHLAARSPPIGPVTHIYASNLSRAVRTAQAIADAQSSATEEGKSVDVVQVLELREKDFGSSEGKRFGARGTDEAAPDFVPSESQEAMKTRVTRFIDTVLVPAIAQVPLPADHGAIIVVAHGIILNVLLRCLLSRFGPDEVAKLARPGDAPWRSEWLATWSNTGYLEAVLQVASPTAESTAEIPDAPSGQAKNKTFQESATGLVNEEVSVPVVEEEETPLTDIQLSSSLATTKPSPPSPSRPVMPIIQLSVKTVNCIDHLQGLKKTRGGIGSAASDSKQKTMDSFFTRPAKKPKTDEGDS